MKQRLCNCKMCRHGRKHKGNRDIVTKHKRSERYAAKRALK